MARDNDNIRATPRYRPCKKIRFWIRLAERVRDGTTLQTKLLSLNNGGKTLECQESTSQSSNCQILKVNKHLKRSSVDAEHLFRFHVWTQNICSVFAHKVVFSNLSGIVWTRPKKANIRAKL